MKLSNVLLHLDTFNSIPESKKHQNIILNNNIGVTLTAILSRLKDNPNIINNSSWDYSSDLTEILFTTFSNIDSSTFNQILAKLIIENQNVLNETTIVNQQIVEKYDEVSLEKMKAFLSYIINDRNLGIGFHIDSSFADYQDPTGKPIFNTEEIVKFDNYIDLLSEWADGNDIDIYGIALDIIQPTIDDINAPGEENPNKDAIEKIENFLYERESETDKVFYLVSAEPSQVVPNIAEYLESCIKSDYNTSPSFIRCEIVGNVITFFELSTFEEPKGKFVVVDEVNTGVFEYSPNIADHNFIEFEGYMDERAELTSGEDNWNCADLIIKLITEDSTNVENPTHLSFDFVAYQEDEHLSIGIRIDGNYNLAGFQQEDDGSGQTNFKYIILQPSQSAKYPEYNNLNILWLSTGYWYITTDNGFEQTIADNNWVNADTEDDSDFEAIESYSTQKELAERVVSYLGTPVNKEANNIFYVISATIDEELPTADDLIKDGWFDENMQPSFIRGEIVDDFVNFYEIAVSTEEKQLTVSYIETGIFKYNRQTNEFSELEGYMDERAGIVDGMDNWNCIEYVKSYIIGSEDDFIYNDSQDDLVAEIVNNQRELSDKIFNIFNKNLNNSPVAYVDFSEIENETVFNIYSELSELPELDIFNDISQNGVFQWQTVNGATVNMPTAENLNTFLHDAFVNDLLSLERSMLESKSLETNNSNQDIVDENEFTVKTENGEILQLTTGIQYNCVLEPKDEDDENTFSLSFYDGNKFVGDCEITTEEVEGSLQIEAIDWTITDYEEEIDINGTLYFNDDLIQALSNFYLE